MGAVTIQQMADRVAALMEERLGIAGRTLAHKVRRGGWKLPLNVRQQAKSLARFAQMAQNPKLLMQIDDAKVAEAYDICVRHLSTISPWTRRKAALMSVGLSIFGSLVLAAIVTVMLLLWRGYL